MKAINYITDLYTHAFYFKTKAHQLFHDQYLAQRMPQRAILRQTKRNTFPANPALAGSNKWNPGDTNPKPM